MENRTTERVLHDLNDLGDDAAESNGEADWSAKAAAAGTALWEVSKATYEHLQDSAAAGARATDRCIRANPYQSLGFALGAGLIIGFLLNRRRSEPLPATRPRKFLSGSASCC